MTSKHDVVRRLSAAATRPLELSLAAHAKWDSHPFLIGSNI